MQNFIFANNNKSRKNRTAKITKGKQTMEELLTNDK